jgi:hypothetical protein
MFISLLLHVSIYIFFFFRLLVYPFSLQTLFHSYSTTISLVFCFLSLPSFFVLLWYVYLLKHNVFFSICCFLHELIVPEYGRDVEKGRKWFISKMKYTKFRITSFYFINLTFGRDYHSHFSPSLRTFVEFALQKHSSLPVVWTLHVSAQLAIIRLQVVEETAAPLSRCYTLHFKGVKYLQNILKYHAMIILFYERVVGVMCVYNNGLYAY